MADVMLYIDNTIQYGEDLDIKVPKVGPTSHYVGMLLPIQLHHPCMHYVTATFYTLSSNKGPHVYLMCINHTHSILPVSHCLISHCISTLLYSFYSWKQMKIPDK